MIHDLLTQFIKKHFYIISYERFRSDTSKVVMERYFAKHLQLKPELIVVNDQPFGFKQIKKNLQSLEQFPIFIEMEYSEEEGVKYVEHIDLYSETHLKIQERISDVIRLTNMSNQTVQVERIKRIGEPANQTLIIYSKISELFSEEYLEDEFDEELVTKNEIEHLFDHYLNSFSQYLIALDEVVNKGKPLSALDYLADSGEV